MMYIRYKHIEELAEKTLIEADCFEVPVKVEKYAAYKKVEISAVSLDDNVSGFFIIKNKTPHIGYSKQQSEKRKRFTIAHELGHFLLHSKETPLFIDRSQKELFRNSEKALFRNSDSSTGELHKEREANAFAAALLMPERLIREELKKIKPDSATVLIKTMSKNFEVSEQAMTIRLTNLGILDFDMC